METKVCSCCGKELPLTEFAVRGIRGLKGEKKLTSFCKSCMQKKVSEGRSKKIDSVKEMRLKDFTPRELMQELKRRGYEFEMTYTEVHTISSKTL